MEVEGLRRIVERWRTDPILDAKVEGYVHDCDAKTRSFMRELWDKPEFLDPNHVLKGFGRKLEHELLRHELKTKLRCWFLMLLKMEQMRLWRNPVDYSQGIHTHCLPHVSGRKPRSSFPYREKRSKNIHLVLNKMLTAAALGRNNSKYRKHWKAREFA
jgi:hypothetical protein